MSCAAAEQEAPIMSRPLDAADWEAANRKYELMEENEQLGNAGFDVTYKRIGSDFDKTYYESDTYFWVSNWWRKVYKKVFYKKKITAYGLTLQPMGWMKDVQRKDGTAVYITQDIGLAVEKYKAYNMKDIYVVGDEQNYHFKVLQLICRKLELPLPKGSSSQLLYGGAASGRMKTREGTVVDADDIDEMIQVAAQKTKELGKVNDFTPDELDRLYNTIGLGIKVLYPAG